MELMNEITIEAVNKVAKDFAELGQYIVNFITSLVKQIVKVAPMFLTDNKRALHLALHHPKARVRKKNFNRIVREIGRHGRRI